MRSHALQQMLPMRRFRPARPVQLIFCNVRWVLKKGCWRHYVADNVQLAAARIRGHCLVNIIAHREPGALDGQASVNSIIREDRTWWTDIRNLF